LRIRVTRGFEKVGEYQDAGLLVRVYRGPGRRGQHGDAVLYGAAHAVRMCARLRRAMRKAHDRVMKIQEKGA
jgi:hypothetical protein